MIKNILIVGVGSIAKEYIKIVQDLGHDLTIVGRSEKNVQKFNNLKLGENAHSGGVDKFLKKNKRKIDCAIVAVGIPSLAKVTKTLLENDIKKILVEKPGFNTKEELNDILDLANKKKAKVMIAYNRRFFSSVNKAIEIIEDDGGVSSFNFEFTEWRTQIENLNYSEEIMSNWFMANSSHVVDLAFYIGGQPKEMNSYAKEEFKWHSPINFVGSGISVNSALFCYKANWNAPGRWGLEFLTENYRLILKPMERLQIQQKNSLKIDFCKDVDYNLDEHYKPGFYNQTKAFILSKYEKFCSINDQQKNYLNIYSQILNSQRNNFKII